MELSPGSIAKLQTELSVLRSQNLQLRRQLHEYQERQEITSFELIRSTIQPKKRIDEEEPKCPHCPHCKPPEKSRKQLVEEFQVWSHRLNSILPMKKHLSDIHSSQQQVEQEGIKVLPPLPNKPKLFQKVCIYGPSLKEMENVSKHERVSHQLYYPSQDPNIQAYGNYFYPERVAFKAIREKKKDVQIDKILFRKSFKYQDCSIFIFFQCSGQPQPQKTPLEKELNPFKTLYSIGLQFSDFICSDNPYKHANDRSMSMTDDNRFQELHPQQDAIVPEELRKEPSVYGENGVFKSNFYLCIFTHLPFVDFFSQFLIRIIDQVKIKRMQRYTENGRKYSDIDIYYVAQEIQKILKDINPLINNFDLNIDQKLNLVLSNEQVSLNLDKSKLLQNITGQWAYRTLKLFDKDSLYQIYNLIMLEETICVVCQNPYLLTFTIHLLVSLLPRPFHYPYPIVSIVFEEEFLETPFTTMLGINKGSKWLEANQVIFLEKMQGKIILNINDDTVKIKTKRKYKLPKSQPLKKIFSNYYKRCEKFDSNKRKDLLTQQVGKNQIQSVASLLGELQCFFKNQLFSYMPNRQIIDFIRTSSPGDNPTTVSTHLIKSIEQYIKQTRKGKQQDPFVNVFMQKQIFYVYLTQTYEIL